MDDTIMMQTSMFNEESERRLKAVVVGVGTLGLIGAQFVAQGVKNIFLLQTAGLASVADLFGRAEKGLSVMSNEMLEYMDTI